MSALAALISAAAEAYDTHVTDTRARISTQAIFRALQSADLEHSPASTRLPVCEWLPKVCASERLSDLRLRRLAEAFMTAEPELTWYRREGDAQGANAAYPSGHANAMIVGPGGALSHDGIWLGVSLLAPGVRYPDHMHPPEETYLVLSEGEFFQEGRGWFAPGIGGTFYNPPGILHAMRTQDQPLFAMWALRAEC